MWSKSNTPLPPLQRFLIMDGFTFRDVSHRYKTILAVQGICVCGEQSITYDVGPKKPGKDRISKMQEALSRRTPRQIENWQRNHRAKCAGTTDG